MVTLQEYIEDLARWRGIAKERLETAKTLDAELHATELGQARKAAFDSADYARDHAALVEEQVREAALAEYARTGDLRPGPGILIKRFESLEYEPGQAKAWCIQSYPDALRYDARMFEKAARVLKPAFVEIVETMKPTIARDLSAHVGESGDP